MPDETPHSGPEAPRSHRYRAVPASPTEVPQVFLVGAQIRHTGAELSETDDPLLFPAQIARFQNAQAFSYDLRRSPAQFANQDRQPLSRFVIQSCLNCRAHASLYYKFVIV